MILMENVRKVYESSNSVALDGIDLTIKDGEFVFLVGPSGSGKTTIMKLITGEIRPTSGTIVVNDFDMSTIKLCVFVLFCVLDNITFTWRWVMLLYPVCLLVCFNIGVGLILSALYVFFRDIQYLWSVFTTLLMYMSAIFYTIDRYSPAGQNAFLLNPVYLFIRYFRQIVIDMTIPSVWFHLLMLADTLIAVGIGCWMYKKYNHRFLYYV